MKVGLVQISSCLGDVQKNINTHLNFIEKAKKKNVDLLIFPELSLTGYSLKDLTQDVAINPTDSDIIDRLKAQSHGISIVFGFVEEKRRGLFFNSSAFISEEKIIHIHRKVFLPTYGMFEEGKLFSSGNNFQTFITPYGPAGMMICYDFLHYGASYLLFVGGSEIILIISAAPGRGLTNRESFASSHMWELMGEAISRFSSSFVIYCNRVGFEEGISFAGGSFIYNPAGKLIAKAPYIDENFLIHEINLDEIRSTRKKMPYKRDEKAEIILEALKRIVRNHEN